MDYITFRNHLYAQGCFNINQVLLWEKDFDRNNLTRWCRKGLLVKLRNEHYAFPEYHQLPGFSRIVANRIYSPSYVSLQSALSFYGIIPEEVIQLTSVTTLKTARFDNPFGAFHYRNVKESLFFGYDIKMMEGGRGVLIATPEKAILDLLYLYPFYETEQDMEELRLDEDFMQNELDMDRLTDYLVRFGSQSLKRRITRLKTVYAL